MSFCCFFLHSLVVLAQENLFWLVVKHCGGSGSSSCWRSLHDSVWGWCFSSHTGSTVRNSVLGPADVFTCCRAGLGPDNRHRVSSGHGERARVTMELHDKMQVSIWAAFTPGTKTSDPFTLTFLFIHLYALIQSSSPLSYAVEGSGFAQRPSSENLTVLWVNAQLSDQ